MEFRGYYSRIAATVEELVHKTVVRPAAIYGYGGKAGNVAKILLKERTKCTG